MWYMHVRLCHKIATLQQNFNSSFSPWPCSEHWHSYSYALTEWVCQHCAISILKTVHIDDLISCYNSKLCSDRNWFKLHNSSYIGLIAASKSSMTTRWLSSQSFSTAPKVIMRSRRYGRVLIPTYIECMWKSIIHTKIMYIASSVIKVS